jgi:chaperonin GroES
MTLRPLGDRVLVLPDAKRTQTESGLVLPEMRWSEDPDISGVVAAVGKGCKGTVAVGNHVTFAAHIGQSFVLDGTPYLVMRESEIAAVLESA